MHVLEIKAVSSRPPKVYVFKVEKPIAHSKRRYGALPTMHCFQ